MRRPATIMLHSNDPRAAERRCSSDFSPAHCAGCCGTKLTPALPHIHVLYGRNKYAGFCSEACAIRGLAAFGLAIGGSA